LARASYEAPVVTRVAFACLSIRWRRPTGGYAMNRRIIAGAAEDGLACRRGRPWRRLSEADLGDKRREKSSPTAEGLPDRHHVLAFASLNGSARNRASDPLIASVHHPLALENGLNPEEAARSASSERARWPQRAGSWSTTSRPQPFW